MNALVCGLIGLLALGGAVGLLQFLGIIASFFFGLVALVLGPVGFGLGISALNEIEAAQGSLRGRTPAVAAMILGVLTGVLGFIVVLLAVVAVGYLVSHPIP